MKGPALALACLVGCGSHPLGPKPPATANSMTADSAGPASTPPAAKAEAPPPALASLLSRSPDLVITVHPPALVRDRIYGPLLRRASELAAAYAGPTNLGTTALAVLERTDEVVVAANDHGQEAVVILRGVPADLDPLQVVDTAGRPLWHVVHGDVHATTRELAPAEATDAALFVAPGLVWIVASGPAIARTRHALTNDFRRDAFPGDETTLAAMSFPGDALPQLRHGALANVGDGLTHVKVELTPGTTGLILGTLTYVDAARAASAEGTVLAVTLAFRHRLEEAVRAGGGGKTREGGGGAKPNDPPKEPKPGSNLDWLGAAKVDRVDGDVVVRAPIPRPWLETLARAELTAPPL